MPLTLVELYIRKDRREAVDEALAEAGYTTMQDAARRQPTWESIVATMR